MPMQLPRRVVNSLADMVRQRYLKMERAPVRCGLALEINPGALVQIPSLKELQAGMTQILV